MTAREELGKLVRDTWTRWAATQVAPKDSWLVPWEELGDGQREVDMLIGEAVATFALFENAITWNTDCTSCGRLLDQVYGAESAAEAERDRLLEELAAEIETAVCDPGPNCKDRFCADCIASARVKTDAMLVRRRKSGGELP